MGPAVDDVGHRNGENRGMVGPQIFIQRQIEVFRRCPRSGQGNAQNRVGAQLPLVFRAVFGNHGAVHVNLIQGVQSHDFRGDHIVYIFYGLDHAFAEVAGLVPVPQLYGFVLSGGGTGGYRCPAHAAALQLYLDFYRWISTGIEDFSGFDPFNNAH
ncbi:hypothetical protein ES707_17085 [subsurface metagenome]